MARYNLPTVVKLEGLENFSQWKELLRSHFSVNRLTKFIDHTDKAPESSASHRKLARCHHKRAIAYAIIRQSVEPVMDALKCYGWVDGKDDPQGLRLDGPDHGPVSGPGDQEGLAQESLVGSEGHGDAPWAG